MNTTNHSFDNRVQQVRAIQNLGGRQYVADDHLFDTEKDAMQNRLQMRHQRDYENNDLPADGASLSYDNSGNEGMQRQINQMYKAYHEDLPKGYNSMRKKLSPYRQ